MKEQESINIGPFCVHSNRDLLSSSSIQHQLLLIAFFWPPAAAAAASLIRDKELRDVV